MCVIGPTISAAVGTSFLWSQIITGPPFSDEMFPQYDIISPRVPKSIDLITALYRIQKTLGGGDILKLRMEGLPAQLPQGVGYLIKANCSRAEWCI